MCGRYQLSVKGKQISERYNVDVYEDKFVPKYNCAPGQLLPVIANDNPGEVRFFRWGLIPYWAKDPSIGYKLINARAETIDIKPAFKKPFEKQRCLIPANGFYEWRKEDKQPYRIAFKDEKIFSMAGIWDVWLDAEERPVYSFAIITVPANNILKDIHTRMPAVLDEKDEWKWLESNDKKVLKNLLKPVADDKMKIYPVSKKVNSAKNEGEELIYPLSDKGFKTLFD